PREPAFLFVGAAQLADPLEAIGVAAKDQKYRRISDPRHVGHERREAIAALAVPDPNDAGLLEIRFRGGRKGCSQQQAQQGFGHGAFGITPMGTPHQDLAQPWQIGYFRRGFGCYTEARPPFSIVAHAHLLVRATAPLGTLSAIGCGREAYFKSCRQRHPAASVSSDDREGKQAGRERKKVVMTDLQADYVIVGA